MGNDDFGVILGALHGAIAQQKPLPKCAAPGCALWVANDAPTKEYNGLRVCVGPIVPVSDKCWYHRNGNEPPHGAH